MSANLSVGIMVMVIIAVGAVGFIMLTNEAKIQMDDAISDPVNNTGIMLNNTTGYETVNSMSTAISDNLIVIIFLGILLVILILMGLYKGLCGI